MTVSGALYSILLAYCTAGTLLGLALLLASWLPLRIVGAVTIAGAVASAVLGRRVLLGRWGR